MVVVLEGDLQSMFVEDRLPVFDQVLNHASLLAAGAIHGYVVLRKGELGAGAVGGEQVVNEVDLIVGVGKVVTVEREPQYLATDQQMISIGYAFVDRCVRQTGLLREVGLVEDTL
jgi:hypothetical protein